MLKSLSLFVGTEKCNANCKHCAGIVHRKFAPKEDGVIDEILITKTLRDCYSQGAKYLSISSSGEPTLSPISVTKVLQIVYDLKKEGIEYSPINLYSNGIKIGEDKEFCEEYLSLWKKLGLTTVYVTVHDIDEEKNAEIYGISKYPKLKLVVSRIHKAGLSMRANLVLCRKTIGTFEKFVSTIEYLKEIGVNSISAWPIRNIDDKPDKDLSPLEEELNKMENWTEEKCRSGFKVRLLREKYQDLYQTGQKLTLFPAGTLSNNWCNN